MGRTTSVLSSMISNSTHAGYTEAKGSLAACGAAQAPPTCPGTSCTCPYSPQAHWAMPAQRRCKRAHDLIAVMNRGNQCSNHKHILSWGHTNSIYSWRHEISPCHTRTKCFGEISTMSDRKVNQHLRTGEKSTSIIPLAITWVGLGWSIL